MIVTIEIPNAIEVYWYCYVQLPIITYEGRLDFENLAFKLCNI